MNSLQTVTKTSSKVCEIGATTAKLVSYKYTPKDKLSSTHVCDVSIYPQIK